MGIPINVDSNVHIEQCDEVLTGVEGAGVGARRVVGQHVRAGVVAEALQLGRYLAAMRARRETVADADARPLSPAGAAPRRHDPGRGAIDEADYVVQAWVSHNYVLVKTNFFTLAPNFSHRSH